MEWSQWSMRRDEHVNHFASRARKLSRLSSQKQYTNTTSPSEFNFSHSVLILNCFANSQDFWIILLRKLSRLLEPAWALISLPTQKMSACKFKTCRGQQGPGRPVLPKVISKITLCTLGALRECRGSSEAAEWYARAIDAGSFVDDLLLNVQVTAHP